MKTRESPRVRACCSLARTLLGRRPRIKLNAALRATIAYFREQLEDSRVAGRQTIPFWEPTTPFQQRPVPVTEDLRTATVHELFPKLPQSFA